MIKLNDVFKPLYLTDKRYILLTGGRGSSKSFHASTFLCQLTYELGQRILFTRYTMSSAEISIIPEFKEKITLLECDNAFRVNKAEITNILNGSEILFRGIKTSSGDQTANLKSINGISCWVVDEAEELVDEETFNTIDLSIRTKGVQNRVILIMNPSNKDHWIYKRFIQNTSKIEFIDGYPVEISTHHEVLHLHTTYLNNINNLNESFLNNIYRMKSESPKLYGHKIIGQWSDIAEGALFNKVELKYFKQTDIESIAFLKHKDKTKEVYESSIAYIDVADEGSDYLCLVVGKNIGNKIYITDVVFSDNNTDITLPLCAEVLNRNNVKYCRVESNSMGAMFGRNLQKEVKAQIIGASSTTNKHTRILMDSIFIREYCLFKHESERSAMYEAFLNQLCLYTKDGKAKHDDAPDALTGLAAFIRGVLSHLYV